MKSKLLFILSIAALTCLVLLSACSTEKKCIKKLNYIESHCPQLLGRDSLKIDTVIKERTLVDTVTVNVDTTGLDSLFYTVDSLLKESGKTDTLYKNKLVKYIQYKYVNKSSNDSLIVDSNGVHLRAWLYDGRIYASVSVDSMYIQSKKAINYSKTPITETNKFNWWKVYFFILLAITILIVIKKLK